MTDYFVDFAPADAVQYDGTNRSEVTRIAGYYSYGIIGDDLVLTRQAAPSIFIREGQWLVRQGDKVWVQDEEPARVERWDEGDFMACPDIDACEESTDSSPPTCDHGTVQERRPVLSNGWTGPWSHVEGGAE